MVRRLSFACLGVALLCASEASALESGGLTLETGSPDALCPELAATREIVARRLGSLVVEGHEGWLARYTIGHAPAGNPRDFVRLELLNPKGEVELTRDLPMAGDSCRTMSEAIALVLDRYFRGLAASEASDPSAAAPVVPRSRKPQSALEPATSARLALSDRGPRLSAEYAVSPGQPQLGLRFSGGLGAKLEAALALRVALTSLEESEAGGASVEARTATSRASLAWKLELPPGLLHFGPALSLAIQRATTRGLQSQTDRTRAIWMAGLELGLAVPVGRSLFIQGCTSLDFLLPGAAGQFLVDNQEVLAPRAVTLGWALGFGYIFGR